jgi:YidC/Oxa1 family membrane protein insertase
MEKRVLLAIFLSFLVLYVYQALVVKPAPKPPAATSEPATAATASPTVPPPTAPRPLPATPDAATPMAPNALALVSEPREREVTVETHDVIAVFTNRGARLKSLRLKHYLDPQTHQPQEIVERDLPNQPLPFSLQTPNESTTRTLNSALYAVGGEPRGETTTGADLRFEYRDNAGLRALKQFHLDPSSYVMTFAATVAEGDETVAPTILWGPAVGDAGEVSRYTQAPEGLVFPTDASKPQRLAAKDLAKQSVYEGDFRFAGVDDNYFMTVALAPGPSQVSYQAITIPPPPGSKDAGRGLIAYSIEPKQNHPIRFFVGPKDFDVLAAIGPDMSSAINFGMFAVIVVPLLRSLKWVHGFIGNWGWSIVLLTVIINAIMFPLRHKSAVSMRKMQEIQPEVKAIQDRYSKLKATDPAKQKMNQELMALYKERGVNPAAGCVPMLLTFPVLFAMWSLLQTSIELRGAPWFGWIRDLSSHDPFYVLPVLMGATSFWQQKMMPATGGDPAQQKMMMFMPLFMMFIFLWLPAGALIYYVVTNVWTIGQQYLTNYLIGPPNVRTVRPAAERRLKRLGGGGAKREAATNEP